ncbi:hypothetical protein [Terasakiella sp. SH-1]|uniref:hypothetical protein n=1 Tax=Terasakiella sp. SH-1 TaxID=2560057 RepID=UPI0010732715|nr:hypothetical protein [Terasakiella sp. SH-1]
MILGVDYLNNKGKRTQQINNLEKSITAIISPISNTSKSGSFITAGTACKKVDGFIKSMEAMAKDEIELFVELLSEPHCSEVAKGTKVTGPLDQKSIVVDEHTTLQYLKVGLENGQQVWTEYEKLSF